MFRSFIVVVLISTFSIANGQKSVSNEIATLQSLGQPFQTMSILKFQTQDIHHRDFNLAAIEKGAVIQLDPAAIQLLLQRKDEYITIPVPISERQQIRLTLRRVEIFAPEFKLFTSDDRQQPVDYTPGLHYRGVVEGDASSLVALSVFQDQVMAMIATSEGNFIIGPIARDADNNHIYYNDRDLKTNYDFECGTPDDALGYTSEQLQPLINGRDVNDCVRLHVEIDDNVVTGKGGATNAVNFVTGMFNQSFLIYTNESINMVLSEILAWTTNSPYEGSTQSEMLGSYKANTEFFNGDLSQLVTYSAVGGSAASTSGLCNGNPDFSKCYSHIDTSYNNFPTYSWTVFVITHEIGHLLGSSHTHSCVWNGNNTAIDGCYAPAGGCPLGPIPPAGGTIMSYCYLPSSGSFVDLTLGFGEQPGIVIRNSVNAADNCITTCGTPTDYCSSNGANSGTEYIDKVVLSSISNLSGNNGGYEDFTSISTSLNAGNTYAVTLTPKFTGGNKTKSWRVWIDYNHDFDWYDAGEMVAQGSGHNALTVNFTVPSNSITITTRMRVSMKFTGSPVFCGTFAVGEVEDYTVHIVAIAPTCADGIQNQGESGIDCGGPCPACPPAPTCSDGIQNQGETGIDCGGPCGACAVSDSTIVLASYFETGMDSWIDGGQDVARVQSGNSWEGQFSIKLADNGGTQSAMTSPAFDLSTAVGLHVSFHFYASSMESGEDFWVLYNDGSGNWVNIGTYIAGTTFNNNAHYFSTISIPNFVPTANGSIRLQCDASDNSDQIFIDAVIITKLNGTAAIEHGMNVIAVEKSSIDHVLKEDKAIEFYPNPATDILNFTFSGEIQSIRLINLDGKIMKMESGSINDKQIDIHGLAPGLYFIWIQSEGKWYPTRFIKI